MTLAVFLTIICLGVTLAAPTPDYNLDAEWEKWKKSYEKTYIPEEEKQRRALWEENVKMIKQHTVENGLWMNNFTIEMNEFGWRRNKNDDRSSLTLSNEKHIQKRNVKIPKTLDWRKEGYVTPVRNQRACGTCWVFAVVGSIEGQLFKKTGRLLLLSVQNLVDCSKSFGTNGCKGGSTYNAYQYVKNNRGLEAEATYPYEAKEGHCKYHPECSVVKITSFMIVPRNEEALLKALVMIGPIAIGINAKHESFEKYRGGMYHEPNCKRDSPNHSMLLVRFGYEGQESEGRKYWRVKNSHGEQWGEKGYMKIPRGQNYCGIASYAMYPVLRAACR